MMRLAAAVLIVVTACGGKPPPPTRYYQLAPPAEGPSASGQAALVVEPLAVASAYDDERMVYRTSPYRLDYYDYHRWTSSPGAMITGYLEQALRKSGRFRSVAAESGEDGAFTLGGRVVAIEEVDSSPTRWSGRVALELSLHDATGKLVWSGQFDQTVAMPAQSPEGLARAITAAMQQVAAKIAPQLGDVCDRQTRGRPRTVWR
jgi:uncharacterized lipoprotein YmbA